MNYMLISDHIIDEKEAEYYNPNIYSGTAYSSAKYILVAVDAQGNANEYESKDVLREKLLKITKTKKYIVTLEVVSGQIYYLQRVDQF